MRLGIASFMPLSLRVRASALRDRSLSCSSMSKRKLYNPQKSIQHRPVQQSFLGSIQGKGVAAVSTTEVTIQQRSGPLPDPATLREYQMILPTAVDRIFALAERDQSFAHTYNLNEQKLRDRTTLLGQLFGFSLGILGIVGAVVLAVYGKELGGGAVFVGAVGTLIFTAVWGKEKSPKETAPQKKS